MEGSISIEASNIILDGAGFTLQGAGIGTGVNIGIISSYFGITVKNLRIDGFETGLFLNSFNDGTITGMTITNNNVGIKLLGWEQFSSSNNLINDNSFSNNQVGISIADQVFRTRIYSNLMDGDSLEILDQMSPTAIKGEHEIIGNRISNIYLRSTTNNVIAANVILESLGLVYRADHNFISENVIEGQGISLYMMLDNITIVTNNISGDIVLSDGCSNCNITSNYVSDGCIGLVKYCDNNIIARNSITDAPTSGIILQWGPSDNTIIENTITNSAASGIFLDGGEGGLVNNKISGNALIGNFGNGILMEYWLSNSLITRNYIEGNAGSGIVLNLLDYPTDEILQPNLIAENNIKSNGQYGIKTVASSTNRICHNIVTGNGQQAYSELCNNIWDDGYPSGGNFWSNYVGVDANADGIGDIPYVIDANNADRYPLMNPWSLFTDGFEGNLGKWTGISVSYGETATVGTTRSHHGTYSGRFTTSGSGGTERAYAYKDIDASSELYARGYFYVSSSGIVESGDRIFFLTLAAGNNNLVWAGERRTSSGTRWCLTIRQGAGFVDVYSSTVPATGRWYCVELHWKKDFANGVAEMWVDGTKVCSTVARNTAANGDATRLKVGLAETYGVSSATVYADCIKLSPFYIGPEPTPPRINSFTASPTSFSPNGDGAKDSSTLAAAFNVPVNWRLDIKSSAGATVRTWTGTGSSFSVIWDGKNNLGTVLPSGRYSAVLSGSDLSGTQFTQATIRVTIDNTRPTTTSVSVYPTAFSPRSGQTTRLTYTLSENCYTTISVYNSAGTSVRTLANNVLQSAGTRSVTWNGKTSSGTILPAGTYTFRLYITDIAGNRAATYPITQTVRLL